MMSGPGGPSSNHVNMNRIPIVFAVVAFLSAGSAAAAVSDDVLQYVDPFIGTTNFGTTNPGAVCPNGLMSVSPFNVMGSDLNVYDKDSRWWSTPYCYENRYFTGFSHVNLSGVGCPELGSLLTMPTTGPLNVDYHVYGSEYSDEQASPGYYTNVLSAYGVKTEVTATMRTSAERYTFPAGTVIKAHAFLTLDVIKNNPNGPAFGLGKGGDKVFLFNAQKVVVDEVTTGSFEDNEIYSTGRKTDGGKEIVVFTQVSKNASNNGKSIKQ